MEYLPFEITEDNDRVEDFRVTMNPTEGRIYVRVGNLDIGIKQSDDGLGVIIDCFDAKTAMQDLGTITIWFDDIEDDEETNNENKGYPIH